MSDESNDDADPRLPRATTIGPDDETGATATDRMVVVLIGPAGAGKSTVGAALAAVSGGGSSRRTITTQGRTSRKCVEASR
jgi:ABC-type cobalamin transport system ATPase subunit